MGRRNRRIDPEMYRNVPGSMIPPLRIVSREVKEVRQTGYKIHKHERKKLASDWICQTCGRANRAVYSMCHCGIGCRPELLNGNPDKEMST